MPRDDRPTAKQQAYLRALAQSTGTSFTPPRTKSEASTEIDRLKALDGAPAHERRVDRDAVERAERGGSSQVREHEITGYGSSSHWKGSSPGG